MLLLTILTVLVLVGGVGYLLIKYRRTNAMNQAIKQKDYEKILELCEQGSIQKDPWPFGL